MEKPLSQLGKKDIDENVRRLWARQAKREAERFEALSAEEWFAYLKYQADLIEISGVLIDWGKKAKPESKRMFDNLFIIIHRMSSYTTNLETTKRMGTALYLEEKARRERAENEMFELRKANEILKKQVEFHENK